MLDYSLPISKNFSLADLTTNPVLSKAKIVAQNGLSEDTIYNNLLLLATNVLEPLVSKYGKNDLNITSCFRLKNLSKNYVSQHELGQAVDIQFPGQWNGSLSTDAWWERVLWIKDNIPYDQFILEYLGKKPWCHISFASNNRKQLLTFYANNSKSAGLHRV
jgi:Peptidase M15